MITQAEHIQEREPIAAEQPWSPRTVAITAGKGGVGKTQIAANLAVALAALRRRVLLVDGNANAGSAEMALGISPEFDLDSVITGEKNVEEIICKGPAGIGFVRAFRNREGQRGRSGSAAAAAGSASLPPWQRERLARQFAASAAEYDFVVLDVPAAALESRLLPLEPAETIIVTTPEPAALADAYATVKTVVRREPAAQVKVLVNMAAGLADAEAAYRAIASVARRFLGVAPGYAGYVPVDPAVLRACRRRAAFVREYGGEPAAAALRALAWALCRAEPPRRGV